MRILLLSANFPDDPLRKVHGVYQRLRMLVDAIKEIGTLDGLFFVGPEIDTSDAGTEVYRRRIAESWDVDLNLRTVPRTTWPEKITRWDAYGRGLIDAFRSGPFRGANGPLQQEALERALEAKPDVLFVHRLTPMAPVLRTSFALPPVVFDLDDVEHVAFARSISQPPTWKARKLLYLQVPSILLAERRAICAAQRTFVCSETDRRYLTRTLRVPGVTVIPNAVELREPQPLPARPSAMFIGSLDYGPNRNAAALLVNEIWPRVRAMVPGAELTVAGRHPERVPGYAESHPGVEFTGFVEDLERLYARNRVVCVPIRAGGGTRIKILEAAAFGKPMVATPLGAEGLDLHNGVHLLERAGVDAFAEAVAALMGDDERCIELGRAARDVVRSRYARDGVLERIRQEVVSSVG